MPEIMFDKVVEASYHKGNGKCILISGKEMQRIGGLPEAFKVKFDYMWGYFEEVANA